MPCISFLHIRIDSSGHYITIGFTLYPRPLHLINGYGGFFNPLIQKSCDLIGRVGYVTLVHRIQMDEDRVAALGVYFIIAVPFLQAFGFTFEAIGFGYPFNPFIAVAGQVDSFDFVWLSFFSLRNTFNINSFTFIWDTRKLGGASNPSMVPKLRLHAEISSLENNNAAQ
ncbi:hypothetical protein CIHG_02017 [Coccidioides immitis H538.4]|uniref:Uncharacterized protein n=3 Tax=Coccidioides immitis TaxID=5501 RepID=A0A0J8TIU7_COCIT|nr:hypothetical protein CIRG_06333 [Coccidioides immitis RMSCC 2394]KMU73662.1 hypothetical protein CISG_03712 [Coccidioides immitis RMSCC 3703]KMU84230.1 hypothetical protein CIHG_02017 [Coccidioides immitis H538.4]